MVGYPTVHLPRHTETKIDELCAKAQTAKTEREVKRVLTQLRFALSEHIGLARQSLEAQISALSTLEAKTKDYAPKLKRTKPRNRQEINPRSGERSLDEGPKRPNAA